jgi:hypothetical protein
MEDLHLTTLIFRGRQNQQRGMALSESMVKSLPAFRSPGLIRYLMG